MNLFFRELKSHRNSLIFWSIGMIALVGASIAKYQAYQTTGQSMGDLAGQFPKMVQVVFGISGFDLAKVSGFFGVIFMYIALMGTIHAILLGSDIISKEERDRTSEFLFVKPISRTAVITSKLLAGFSNLIVLNIITLAASVCFVGAVNKTKEPVTHDILILMGGLFFLQLIFFAVGCAIAGVNKKPKFAPGAATSTLLATFFLYFIVNLNDKLNILKYLTPFKYFDAKNILADGKLDPLFIGLSGILITLFIIVTYRSYSERDLNI